MATAAAAAFLLLPAGMADASQLPVADTNAAPTPIVAPTQVSLPPVAAKVLSLSEAGVSDDSIISYIHKSANSYALTAEQIIYLHDLGLSATVLQALVADEGAGGNAVAGPASSGTAGAQDASATPAESTPPVSGPAANFYDALAPYGTWVDVPAYGWCWQPTVVVVNPEWQPYCDNGSWLWSDQGWYWNSSYSWGWAPFHYGRWCRYQGYGWLWCPDNNWGPAWVCWRDYPGYCGWAPLPPGGCFTASLGWTFNGLAVGVNYGFGLGPRCFTFCDYDNFCRRHPFDHFRHGRDADRFFDHSRVNNDFAVDAHHRFINRGIDPSRIETATHTRITQVAIRDIPHGDDHRTDFTRPDRMARDGNTRIIYRPGHDLTAMRNRFQHGTPSARPWGGESTTQPFTAERTFANARQFQVARPNGWQPSASGFQQNRPAANMFNHSQSWVRAAPAPAVNPMPAQNYRRDFPGVRDPAPAWHPAQATPAAPTWHPAQAWHSRPTWNPPQAWHSAPVQRSAPVWNSAPAHSWGGGTHFGGGTPSFQGGGAQSRGGWRR